MFRRIHGMPAAVLRRSGQLWDTVFAGERAQDAGGPYREAWSALCVDLVSPYLPLLKPCPNNEGKVGLNQDTFVFNPDCERDSIQLEMLVFLGKLMGTAARNKQYMDMSLAPAMWKILAGQNLWLDDLRAMDINGANQLQWFRSRYFFFVASMGTHNVFEINHAATVSFYYSDVA